MKYSLIISISVIACASLNAMTPEEREHVRAAWLARAELLQNRALQEPQEGPVGQPAPIQQPAAAENGNPECIICGLAMEELAEGQPQFTTCCGNFICRDDYTQLEQRAHGLYQNMQDPEWRQQFAASPDFAGWPVAEEHARCPFCRNYPLITRPMPLPDQDHAEQAPQQQQCLICLEEKNERDFKRLGCHHIFCTECLTHVVDAAIRERSTARLRCPNIQCAAPISEQDIRIITDNNRETLNAIAAIRTQEWIATQPNAKHCPTPDCPYVFLGEENCRQSVRCLYCQREYCSHCLFPHMQTITCEQVEQNRRTDEADEDWLQRNTRPCPRCGARIIRDGGCNYVRCTNCNLGFCYYCNGNHHGGACELAQVMPIQELQANDYANQQPILLQPHRRQFPACLEPAGHNPRQRNQCRERQLQAPEHRACQQNIAQDRAYILQVREKRDITGIQDYKDLMNRMHGRKPCPRREIVVCLPQNVNIDVYANFVNFLNQLCHEHRPKSSTGGVKKYPQARRIVYSTTIDQPTFQGLLDQVNHQFFQN